MLSVAGLMLISICIFNYNNLTGVFHALTNMHMNITNSCAPASFRPICPKAASSTSRSFLGELWMKILWWWQGLGTYL